jgi:hypothetical protein
VVPHSKIENIKKYKLKRKYLYVTHWPIAMADQSIDSVQCVTDQSLMSFDQKQSFSHLG